MATMQAVVTLPKSDPVEINGDTPTLRLFALLEVIASKDQYFSLQSLADETDVPKPTLHRMLQQLENAHLLERSGDGRQYGTGVRLRRLAENLLLNDTAHGARLLSRRCSSRARMTAARRAARPASRTHASAIMPSLQLDARADARADGRAGSWSARRARPPRRPRATCRAATSARRRRPSPR